MVKILRKEQKTTYCMDVEFNDSPKQKDTIYTEYLDRLLIDSTEKTKTYRFCKSDDNISNDIPVLQVKDADSDYANEIWFGKIDVPLGQLKIEKKG